MPFPVLVLGAMALAGALGYGGSKYGEKAEKEAEQLRTRTLDRLKTKEMELARKRKSLYDRLVSYSDVIRSHLQSAPQSGARARRKLPPDLQNMVDTMSAAVAVAGAFAPQISQIQSSKNTTALVRTYQTASRMGGPNGGAAQAAAVAAAAYAAYEGFDKAITGHRNLEATKKACQEAETKMEAALGGIQKAHDSLALQWDAVVVPRIPDLQRRPVQPAVVQAMKAVLKDFEEQIAAGLWEDS